MSSSSLLQLLASEAVSEALLFWIHALPLEQCQNVRQLCELRDTAVLSEILLSIDEPFFRDLRAPQFAEKQLWLVHLVQLKKLFLKLSAFVELHLQQDWSLLPVPDFRMVARSETNTGHLNFIVAAVLLTATHSGKHGACQDILTAALSPSIRHAIQDIQDHFVNALETRQPTSPRRSSLSVFPGPLGSPKKLFSSPCHESRGMEVAEESHHDTIFSRHDTSTPPAALDIPVASLTFASLSLSPSKKKDNHVDGAVIASLTDYELPAHLTRDHEQVLTQFEHLSLNAAEVDHLKGQLRERDMELTQLRAELTTLRSKNGELERAQQLSRDREAIHVDTKEALLETQTRLLVAQDELNAMRERQERERGERNSFITSFHQERRVLEDTIAALRDEMEAETCRQQEQLARIAEEQETSEEEMAQLRKRETELADAQEELQTRLDKTVQDNVRLVASLKKARDHILRQDALLKETQMRVNATNTSADKDADLATLQQELVALKESYVQERTVMNQALADLGSAMQRSHLLSANGLG